MSASVIREQRGLLSLIVAGLLFGVGFRAGEAAALDGGEGRCEKTEYAEFVEVARVEGTGDPALQTFWRRRAGLTVNSDGGVLTMDLAVYNTSVDSEDDILILEEDAP